MSSGGTPTKYVFVTGGVVSALGKGIVAASLGRLLKARELGLPEDADADGKLADVRGALRR